MQVGRELTRGLNDPRNSEDHAGVSVHIDHLNVNAISYPTAACQHVSAGLGEEIQSRRRNIVKGAHPVSAGRICRLIRHVSHSDGVTIFTVNHQSTMTRASILVDQLDVNPIGSRVEEELRFDAVDARGALGR